MKRAFAAILVLVLAMSLVSCKGAEKPENTSEPATSQSNVISDDTTASENETSADTTQSVTKETSTSAPTLPQIDNNADATSKADETTILSTEPASESTTQGTTKFSGEEKKIKNGTLSTKNGCTYITDDKTGVTFLIVNKTYTVPDNYGPGGLTSECSSAFAKLKAAAASDGIDINNRSAYRSYSYQKQLYNNYVERDGKAEADRYSARPGHSEHQTGLAIDCNSLSQSFADTAEGKWLAANCYKYGFVLRFLKGKEAETGYMYEPWHIRYIGSVELATNLTQSGLCIEEYYGITSTYAD